MSGAYTKLIKSLQRTGQICPGAKSNQDVKREISRLLLGFPPHAAKSSDISELFGKSYAPGTFTLGEIRQNGDFLCGETSIGYENWVKREIQREIQSFQRMGKLQTNARELADLEDDVLELLSYQFENGQRLNEQIALQEYTDIFRRIILALLWGEPELEINFYESVNKLGKEIALEILERLNDIPLRDLLKTSIAAGLIGLNLKTSAAATSQIFQAGIVEIDPDKSASAQVNDILQSLRKKADAEMGIDYWKEYEARFLSGAKRSLVVFTDDYIETIFDLKFIERQLEYNPNLSVSIIPRAKRYGNDASYEDLIKLVEHPRFLALSTGIKQGRVDICPDGPRLGTVNGGKISQNVAERLKRCDGVVVKGARAYEMLQGIGKPAYFGFAVCREISEVVTGLNAEAGQLVFIRQHPYQHTFQGFRNRSMRPYQFPLGRVSLLCPVSAKDCYEQDLLPSFYAALHEQGQRALQTRNIQISPYIDGISQDLRRGLTLIIRPSQQVVVQLANTNEHLRQVAPQLFYYDQLRFHFTILSLITAHEGFEINTKKLDAYVKTIRNAFRFYSTFSVDFLGIASTPNSLIAKGYPHSGVLTGLRSMLKMHLDAVGLGEGIDDRYPSRGAHVTLARLKDMEDFQPLLTFIENLREVPLGHMDVIQAQLVINDFYMSPDKIKVVAAFELNG